MESKVKIKITVTTNIEVPLKKVWRLWTTPEHIIQWNNASEDWCTPWAKNDLQKGGRFVCRMEARDGSTGFDFEGRYDDIEVNTLIAYTIADGRKVTVTFTHSGEQTTVTEVFQAENENPVAMQRDGWQAILNNFKKYAESN